MLRNSIKKTIRKSLVGSYSTAAVPARILKQAADARKSDLGAFINVFSDNVIEEYFTRSKVAEESGLKGLSVGVKDLFCTHDSGNTPTTAASDILSNYVSPKIMESTAVKEIINAGGILIGKTNLDQFGMGSFNMNSAYGPSRNPLMKDRVAGGSSGGSAAAVAGDLCDVALATDTGGSTRLPASYCNIVGFKPSYGLISRWGVITYASSLDCVGIMSKSIQNIVATFESLDKHDEKDPTSVTAELRTRVKKSAQKKSLKQIKIGIPLEFFPKELNPLILTEFRKVVKKLQNVNIEIVSVSLPAVKNALGAYYIIATAEAGSNLARYDGVRFGKRHPDDLMSEGSALYTKTRTNGFGKEVKNRLLMGAFSLSADMMDNYYLKAQSLRRVLRQEFDDAFLTKSPLLQETEQNLNKENQNSDKEKVDFLLHPTTINIAPLLNEVNANPTDGYVQDILSVPASLSGLPSISLPMMMVDGLPAGVQLTGQWGCDRDLLHLSQQLMNL